MTIADTASGRAGVLRVKALSPRSATGAAAAAGAGSAAGVGMAGAARDGTDGTSELYGAEIEPAS
jgi:hypothetical protein